MHLPAFPVLGPLHAKPTWVNRAGRVDRSACIEVRASELRKLTNLKLRRTISGDNPEAVGQCTITGKTLRRLHGLRRPYHLSGDHCTRKSNAMKDPANTHGGQFNPNKGAARTKLLGFFDEPDFMAGWSQTVRIVRWRSHQRLGMHFLICPACERKFLKLFAVLCSHGELHDATIAEAWIEQAEARHAAMRKPLDVHTIALREKLIRRYGLLFRKRRVVCRKCLRMRYGEVRRAKRMDDPASALARGREDQRRAEARYRRRMEHSAQAIAALRELLSEEDDATRQAGCGA